MSLWSHHLLSTLSFFLALMFVASILRARRAPGSTMAWLLIICLVPYIGIPLYLIFSNRKFTTRLQKKAKIYGRFSQPRSASELSSIQRILRSSGVPEPKLNERLDLLPTGVTAFERITDLIRNAKHSIYITTFIFGNDEVGRAVVSALAERAAAGLDVRVLVDSLGATLIRHPSFSSLKNAGGKLAYFMPVIHLPFKGRANLRNHRKLMVVDSEIAVLGGMNLAKEYLGPTDDPHRWVDLGIAIEGGCVADVESVFLQDWAYATREAAGSPEKSSSTDSKDGPLAQVVASGPDVVDDPLYDVLFSAINEAQKTIRIVTPYFIPDESLTKALELAAKRGVEVQIVIPRRSNHRLADLARGSFVRQLSGVGVHFGLYPRMIHAKAVMIDRRLAIVGSANFDMRSLLLNFEIGILIYSEQVLHSVEEWMRLRLHESAPAKPKSGFWRDLAEGLGRVVGPLL